MERHDRLGVYFIFQAMERGWTFQPCGWSSAVPATPPTIPS